MLHLLTRCPEDQARQGADMKTKDTDGKSVFGTDGKPLKKHIKMSDTKFNGQTQHLYHPDVFPKHPELADKFKGMAPSVTV